MMRLYRPHLPLLILAGLLIILALAFLWLHLVTPFDNGRIQPGGPGITAEGLLVTPLEGGPEGFEVGDLVTAVGGRSIESWADSALAFDFSRTGLEIGDTVGYTIQRGGAKQGITVVLGSYPLGAILWNNWGTIAFALAYLAIAAYVFLRRSELPSARLLLLTAAALFSATTWSLGAQISDFVGGLGLVLYLLTIVVAFCLTWVFALHFALVFPEPAGLLQRRWFVPTLYGVPFLLLALYAMTLQGGGVNSLAWVQMMAEATTPFAAIFLSATLVTVIWQYRSHREGSSSKQIRWLVLAALLVGGSALILYFIPPLLGGRAIDSNIVGLIGILFPLAIAIAILRYNLFDIDTLLNRTLVYGGLTAVVVALYVLIVTALGILFQAQGNLLVALITTGFVAILFQPLRDRLQRGVNRLMYGERDEPFEVLSQLGEQLAGVLSPDMIYPTIVRTVAQTLKLPYVAIAVKEEDGFEIVEAYGLPDQEPAVYPLITKGEEVGRLLASRRGPDEDFTEADQRLLRNIARQTGAAVQAVQLTADLQRSRQRLVTSREEERRRLRRDLHDGLGSTLAAMHLQAGILKRKVGQDPDAAVAMVDDMRLDVRSAIEEIRKLVYELRPPALDELGLVAAVRAQAERYQRPDGEDGEGLQVRVEAPDELPPLPAAVEVAAYRIVQEALANIAHRAGVHRAGAQHTGSHCLVRLELDGPLWVEVIDDGAGIALNQVEGVGLSSMRERALELGGSCDISPLPGGGTHVRASLPSFQDGVFEL